jgi:hypothetical protein
MAKRTFQQAQAYFREKPNAYRAVVYQNAALEAEPIVRALALDEIAQWMKSEPKTKGES